MWVDWLGDEVGGACLKGLVGRIGACQVAQDDYIGLAMDLLQSSQHLQRVAAAHLEAQQNQFRHDFAGFGYAFLGGKGRVDNVFLPKDGPQQLTGARLIVHDEHTSVLRGKRSRLCLLDVHSTQGSA